MRDDHRDRPPYPSRNVMQHRPTPRVWTKRWLLPLLWAALVCGISRPAQAQALRAHASASGPVELSMGPGWPTHATGFLALDTIDADSQWPMPSQSDWIQAVASLTTRDARLTITIEPVPSQDGAGASGVEYHRSDADADISVSGWATVRRDGEVIAGQAPAHLIVTRSGPRPGILLTIEPEGRGAITTTWNFRWSKLSSLILPDQHAPEWLWGAWIVLLIAIPWIWQVVYREWGLVGSGLWLAFSVGLLLAAAAVTFMQVAVRPTARLPDSSDSARLELPHTGAHSEIPG